MRAQLTTFTYS